MRLLEFESAHFLITDVLNTLSAHFKVERVGGKSRTYIVGDRLGAIFLINSGPKAVGISWDKGSTFVHGIYIWDQFELDNSPDYEIDIPEIVTPQMLDSIVNVINNPHGGLLEAANDRKVSVDDFINMAKQIHGQNISNLSQNDLHEIALKNGVTIPMDILDSSKYKKGNVYDLSKSVPEKTYLKATRTTVKFNIPNIDKMSQKVDDLFTKTVGSDKSMEDQYEELKQKVELVAGNKSNYIKSLLIVGAPSSGKSFTVMNTIKEMGLAEGRDYIVIKGSITDASLYTTLIEQIDSLTIFDDCDSVVDSPDGRNMLKNALDTYAIRDINRSTANTINTKQMPFEERMTFVDAVSRVLRGNPTDADMTLLRPYVPKKKEKKVTIDKDDYSQYTLNGYDTEEFFRAVHADPYKTHDIEDYKLPQDVDPVEVTEMQAFFSRRPPNRIDFRGRIIFISNMDESQWDSAILTRAFYQNMDFSNDEMLEFLGKIVTKIDAPQLTDEQKLEVYNMIKKLYEEGHIHSRINFRLLQKAFDLRLCSGWQKMLAGL